MSPQHRHGGTTPTTDKADYPKLNHSPGAKWIKHLTSNRLATFNGGHFADVNLSSTLFVHRLDDSHFVKLQVWSAPGLSKPSFGEAMKQKFIPAKKGDSFGPSCEYWWSVSACMSEVHLHCLHRGMLPSTGVLDISRSAFRRTTGGKYLSPFLHTGNNMNASNVCAYIVAQCPHERLIDV